MSRWYSYINSAKQILSQYKGDKPFALFIKEFFSRYKKYGSGDRKQITHLCYCYFRCSPRPLKGELNTPIENLVSEENILTALFLCSTRHNELLAQLKPEWNEKVTSLPEDKITLLNGSFSINNIFPWRNQLSEGIDATAFAKSHLIQPDLFIRIRPGKKEQVTQQLKSNNIAYTFIKDACIALPNNTKIDELLVLNKEGVVQDYSSQRISEFFDITKPVTDNRQPATKVWDCCAASGGKSLLAVDVLQNVDLTVSDVRSSIIHNLKQRFYEAGIKNYNSFIADLSHSPLTIHHSPFDLIICDVPCTGSGTWGRTPERLYFFSEDKIDYYASLQKKIVSNVIPYIKPCGYFLYITCSVFKKENEAIVDFILSISNLKLIKNEVMVGYDKKADTMFGALFAAILPT